MESITAIRETVQSLIAQNELLKTQNELLQSKVEDLEQYGRHTSLRIFNVPTKAKESAEDVRSAVVKMIKDADIEIDVKEVDRAHRIGMEVEREMNGKKTKVQPIIVKLRTFRTRTHVYRQKKRIHNIRTSIDSWRTISIVRHDRLDKASN